MLVLRVRVSVKNMKLEAKNQNLTFNSYFVPRLGKRELICLLSFTCNYVVLFGEVSSSSGCLGWATLFYCGTP